MIISRCRKIFPQNSTSFHEKTSDETTNRRNVPQLNKTYGQHHTTWGKTETISSKVKEAKVFILPIHIQSSPVIPSQSNKIG
jgi:hypothetical protein